MGNEIHYIIGLFLILFLIVLIALGILLEEDDKRRMLLDSGWFSVTFALIVIGLANPNINCSNTLIILTAMVLIMLLVLLVNSMLSKWYYMQHGKIHKLKFINNSHKNIYLEIIPHNSDNKLIDLISIGQKIEYDSNNIVNIKFGHYIKTNFNIDNNYVFIVDNNDQIKMI